MLPTLPTFTVSSFNRIPRTERAHVKMVLRYNGTLDPSLGLVVGDTDPLPLPAPVEGEPPPVLKYQHFDATLTFPGLSLNGEAASALVESIAQYLQVTPGKAALTINGNAVKYSYAASSAAQHEPYSELAAHLEPA